MAKKYYNYVLVLTDEGAKFVTGTGANHTCYWDGTKPPMDFPAYYAEDMALGLRCNGFLAFYTRLPHKLETQLYRYDKGHFEWKMNEEEKEGEET